MSHEPKVTVLMAVYNGERYLQESIESILTQSYQDFEFVIINDGSTDRSREVILSYNDSRIRLVDNSPNIGLTRSLNHGLRLARGQFIARQDADDISEPERLSRQVAFLEAHKEVALLGTWYKKIDARGNFTGYRKLPCDYIQICWSLLFFCPFVHSAVILRKSAIIQVGLYDESLLYAQDYDLWCRIARYLQVANLDEYLVRYRINPWSMTATYGDRTLEAPRISIDALAHLLSWDRTEIAINEWRFSTMASLLYGSRSVVILKNLSWATEEVLRLQSIFCQYYGIGRAECHTHRANLRSYLSRRLVEIVYSCSDQNNRIEIWKLIFIACRLHWSNLFTKRLIQLTLKLLIGPRLVKMVRHLARKEIN